MYYQKFKDAGGYWRWRLRAANHKIIADSGEGYVSESSCDDGIVLNKSSSAAPVYSA